MRVTALAAKEEMLKSVFISLVLLYAVLLLAESALGYFGFNTVELLICAILLTGILRQYSSRPALVYLAGILLLLILGFALAYFKLLYVEKNVLFLLSAFVATYLLFHLRQQTIYFVLSLFCANVAIYYKEPVFCGGCRFYRWSSAADVEHIEHKSRLLDGLRVTSVLTYIGIYLVAVWPDHGTATYAPGGV